MKWSNFPLLFLFLSKLAFAAQDYCKDGTGLYNNVCFNDDLSDAVDDLQTEIDSQVTAESQARVSGDASTLSSANNYTDNQVTAESQARISGDASTLSSANKYTNDVFSNYYSDSERRLKTMDNKINRLSNRMNAAIASSTAIASIPYVAENNFSFGVGVGNYKNGNAMAVGTQYKTSTNTNVRLNVAWDSSGNSTSGAGFSAGW